MANTTFQGPVRSEGGFEVITKNTTTGAITTNLDIDASGNITATGDVAIGPSGALKLTSATVTTATIAVTHSQNVDVSFTQPAGTIINDLIAIPAGNIVTAGNSGDDVDFDLGTSAGGGQIIDEKALLDDGGSAVTATANTALYIIENGVGAKANKFATNTTGPATNEEMTVKISTHTAAERTLHIRLKALATNLATAATTVKFIIVFQYV
tara:strand:- start:409 stop:1041 length:633 start_codon:yes stop_codon:yes gene_type:complete